MEYIVALCVATLLCSGGVAFVVNSNRTFRTHLQEQIELLPVDATRAEWQAMLDNGMIPPVDVEVSPSMLRNIELSQLLSRFWPVWVSLVIGGCLFLAYLVALTRK